MKIVGVIPARMAASRFPGKPLEKIAGIPMVEHVFHRANMYKNWDGLFIATCDEVIKDFCVSKKFPVIMTSTSHTRALDRVAEAASLCEIDLLDTDIVVCVQGDEPMMRPGMVDAVVQPLLDDSTVSGTILGMEITSEELFMNPDIVKIVHDKSGDVTYTSRSPIPYCKSFPPVGFIPRRIYGIFAFRWGYLKKFTSMEESPLELAEACDSNRLFDNGLKQRVAPYPNIPSFSVDSIKDIELVEKHMKSDLLWGKY